MSKQSEKLEAIDKQIEGGLDKEDLLKARQKLYKIKDYELTNEEWTLKVALLNCIAEYLEADRK